MTKRGAPRKYPFYDMSIGDVKFYPTNGDETIHSLRSRVMDAARRAGKFKSRTIEFNGQKGLAIRKVG